MEQQIKKGMVDIMKLGKNIFWGIFLIAAAAFIIVGSFGCFGDVSGWTIAFSMLLLAWFVRSLLKLQWGGILFSLAFAAILFDELLGIQAITPWPVLGAALLGTIGLNMIFKKKHKEKDVYIGHKYGNANVVDEQTCDDETFRCEVAFGSSVKYVNSKSLKRAYLENAFGSLVAYFDTAQLYNGEAVVSVENSFGKMTLYIPREWNTIVNVDKAFGNVSEIGRPTGESGNRLYIEGESSFGQLEIQYI